MIKRFIIYIFLVILSTGCKKWLDVSPKTHVAEKVLFYDEQGFKDALIGIYVEMASRPLYAKEFTMGLMDVLAQNYDANPNSHRYYQASLYNYEDVATKALINNLWVKSYKVISNINNLLSAIDEKKNLFSGDNYEIIKGEALGLRAFLHFNILRAFGPIPVSGLNEKAIPYLKEFEMNVKPFLTMQEVLNLCINDLNESRILLSVKKEVVYGQEDVFLGNSRNRMNYWAVTGLMSRIYLYEDNKPEAYNLAMEVINSKKFPFVTSEQVSSSISPDRLFIPEHLFGLYVSDLQDVNEELFKSSAGSSILTNKESFINNLFEVSLGGSTDYRYLFLWKTEGSSSAKYPAKYWLEDQSSSGTRRVVPLIRLTEMYYIAAETSSSLEESTNLLNEVRTHRGLKAFANTLDSEEKELEVFKEYKKEFCQEGQLFFYYKRKNFNEIDGFSSPVDEKIYMLPVPDDEIEFNS